MMDWNYIAAIFLSVYLVQVVADLWLERLNLQHADRSGSRVLSTFQGFVDASKLARIGAYTREKSRLGTIQQVVSETVLLAWIVGGFMASLARSLEALELHYLTAGLIFLFAPGLILAVVELPFDYYHTFILEEKFGFNRTTLRTWLADHLKATLLSVVLSSVLIGLILWMLHTWPQHWWLIAFLVISAFQFLMAVLYPKLIAPLFNKFEPVQDEILSRKIQKLMEENGFKVKRILQMNAGVRSRHTNAYFTGLGRTKQIVLYDTLLDSHPHCEILSVLAHELGHFKGKHILKQLVLFEAGMFFLFYLTHLLIDWPLLYSTFGLDGPRPYAGLFLIGLFWQKAGFFLQPFYMALSRKYEREADLFAARLLKTGRPLITSFKRMAADNLTNLAPHPLYVRFNYSHPPLVERIRQLEAIEPPAGATQCQSPSPVEQLRVKP